MQATVQHQLAEESRRLYSDLELEKIRVEQYWKQEFEGWKARELESIRSSIEERYQVLFDQWKAAMEQQIRQDAVNRSKAVVIGQITEHMVPFMQDFKYNPKDARFLGTPVDLIVFDGLTEGRLRRIVFIEVKSGANNQLSPREKQVRDAVLQGSVAWELYYRPLPRLSDTSIDAPTEADETETTE
ncbi:hypothetical protein HPY42_00685 [Coprothermobacteraceae bacterium]|nr:hypothetical protein [Coprothermobacteraceae bacterium]